MKEILKCLEMNKDNTTCPNPLQYNETSSQREMHTYKVLHKKIRAILSKYLNYIPYSLGKQDQSSSPAADVESSRSRRRG